MAKKDDVHQSNLEAILDNYIEIYQGYDKVAAGATPPERALLDQHYQQALNNFLKAANAVLGKNTKRVQDIRKDLEDTTKKIRTDLSSVKNVAATINLIAEGVALAVSLATVAV